MFVVISDVKVTVSRMVSVEAHTRASKVFFPEIIKRNSRWLMIDPRLQLICLSDKKLNFFNTEL